MTEEALSRHQIALDLLAPEAGERLLEIGPGTAAAAELLLARVPDAHLTLVDRSATAVARIGLRLAEALAAQRVTLLEAELADLPVDDAAVTGAYGINVNAFWTSMALGELSELVRVLSPGGRLVLVYGDVPDPARLPAIAATVAANLMSVGLDVEVQRVEHGVAALLARRP